MSDEHEEVDFESEQEYQEYLQQIRNDWMGVNSGTRTGENTRQPPPGRPPKKRTWKLHRNNNNKKRTV